MENNTAKRIWKKLTVASMYDLDKIIKSENVEDDIIMIRKKMDRRGLISIISVICAFGLCVDFTYSCTHGEFSYPRLFNILLFGSSGIFMLYGWWQSYRWQQAEIYFSTKEYMELSADIIRRQINLMKNAFYYLYGILLMINIVFFLGASLQKAEIMLGISIISVLILMRSRPYMRKSIEGLSIILNRLEATLANLNSEI